MYFFTRLLPVALAAILLTGAAKKPDLTVRFHAEANRMDSERFAQPVTLKHPPRQAHIEKVASLSERHIQAIYPFRAEDGSWGCAFKLNQSGRINLEVLSTERRGASLVAFVSSKTGTHQVIDMQIDRPITDGIITIHNGLTDLEIAALQKQFPTLGQPQKKRR
ncbi:MAG: hypothetical protein ACO1QR_10375 [Chthoniobacteraceae bacterium]